MEAIVSSLVKPLELFLLCVAILSTSVTMYKFCRIPGGKWYEIHWGSCVILCILFLVFFRFLNFPIWNSLLVIGEFIAIATHSRNPITLLINWNKVALFLVAAFVLMIIMQLPLSFVFISNEYGQETPTAIVQSGGMATVSATSPKATAQPTAQTYASPTTFAAQKQYEYTKITNMTPTFSDPLSDNSSGFWDVVKQCSFISGSFHISTVTPASTSSCRSHNPIVSQYFAFQVQMTIVKGSDGGITGGFLLLNEDKPQYYGQYYGNAILIGLGGGYTFNRSPEGSGNNPPIISSGTASYTSVLHKELGQTNQITVIVGFGIGNLVDIYINGQYVASSTPGISFPSNFLVFFASSDTSTLGEVAYSHAKLWNDI